MFLNKPLVFPLQDKKRALSEQDFDFWYERFHNELCKKIHAKALAERSFLASFSNKLASNHFPYVFWKAPFVFDLSSWRAAGEIMPNLYYASSAWSTLLLYQKDSILLPALLNYALWRGHFSWLYSLAALAYQYGSYNRDLFQIASLTLAFHKDYAKAQFYSQQIAKPSPYFELALHILSEGAYPFKLSSKLQASEEEDFFWLYAIYKNDRALEKTICANLCAAELNEESLLLHYTKLLTRGLLFRAARLVLHYAKKYGEKSYILHLLLQSYLENQKHYSYLLRLIASTKYPSETCWYEVEYCMACLHMTEGGQSNSMTQSRIWARIHAGKKEAKFLEPPAESKKIFQHAMFQAVQNAPAPEQKLPVVYASMVQDYYLHAKAALPLVLRRRYLLCEELILKPLRYNEEVDPNKVCFHSFRLFHLLSLHMDSFSLSPFFQILESMSGRILNIRALLGLYFFYDHKKKQSRKYLAHSPFSHPMIQSLRRALCLEAGELEQASRIEAKLASRLSQA